MPQNNNNKNRKDKKKNKYYSNVKNTNIFISNEMWHSILNETKITHHTLQTRYTFTLFQPQPQPHVRETQNLEEKLHDFCFWLSRFFYSCFIFCSSRLFGIASKYIAIYMLVHIHWCPMGISISSLSLPASWCEIFEWRASTASPALGWVASTTMDYVLSR